jgi:hypothetical protein
MQTPARRVLAGLVVAASVSLGLGAPPLAAVAAGLQTVDARVSGAFLMHGRILTALRVRGERRGQTLTPRWEFTSQSCFGSACERLSLRRQRSANRYDHLELTRVGIGVYTGRHTFYARLRCKGRIYPRGEVVPYRITMSINQGVAIQAFEFASTVTATYTNLTRIDRTPCPTGPSHDSAGYIGVASPLPSVPTAGFTVVPTSPAYSDRFADTSSPGASHARIVSRRWDFSDPRSGSANTASGAIVSHRFSAPGIYRTSLTVIDANGLTSTASQPVFTAQPAGG